MTEEKEKKEGIENLYGFYESFKKDEGALARAGQQVNDLETLLKKRREYVGEKEARDLEQKVREARSLIEKHQAVTGLNFATVLGYFNAHQQACLRSVEEAVASEPQRVYSIEPQNINGDDEHNEKAKLQRKIAEYAGALKNPKKLKEIIQERIDKAKKEADEEIDRNLKSHRNYEYFKDFEEEVRNFKEVFSKEMVSERIAVYLTKPEVIIDEAREEFEKSFGEDNRESKIAQYARKNLERAYEKAKEKQEKFAAIEQALRVYKPEAFRRAE